MDDQLTRLEEAFCEEYSSALILLKHEKLTSVTILLSKALFALADYIIYNEFNVLPKNHAERFRILLKKKPVLYTLLDEIWNTYTDAYSKPAVKESISLLQAAIQKIIKENETISEKIKESIG